MTLLQDYVRTKDAIHRAGRDPWFDQNIAHMRADLQRDEAIRLNGDIVSKLRDGAVETDAGWFKLIGDCLDHIKVEMNKHPDFTVNISCIKEKFGTLRIYYQPIAKNGDENKQVPDALCTAVSYHVRHAEKIARCTCEICGEKGELRGGMPIQTLCYEHAELLKRPSLKPVEKMMHEPEAFSLDEIITRIKKENDALRVRRDGSQADRKEGAEESCDTRKT